MHKTNKNRSFLTSMYGIGLILSIIGSVLFFVLPMMTSDRKSWVVGSMSSSHKFIEGDCGSCHSASFAPIKDESCLACHNVSVHPITHPAVHPVENQNKEARDYRLLQPTCVECHLEHSGDQALVINDPRTCITCHGDLKSHFEKTKLQNVLNFKLHPEFSKAKIDQAKIKLNHEVHLKKNLRAENGYKTLACGDCHQMDQTRKLMKPVSYQENCSSCHKLEFDSDTGIKKIPHVSADSVLDFLYKENLALYYSKNKHSSNGNSEDLRQRPGLNPDQGKIVTEVLRSAREAEKEIFMDRGCALCHFVKKKPDSISLGEAQSQYEIEKPEIPIKWFPNSEFKHQSHEILTCENCHAGVRKSTKTENISLPMIKDCNSCHSKQGGASENCITCHSYHQSFGLDEGSKRARDEILLP